MLRAKPTTFYEVLREELGYDMLVVANVDHIVDDIGDRFAQAQANRWYSALLRSSATAAWRARSLAGGIYTPPEREDVSLANSGTASNSFSFAPPFFPFAFLSSMAAMRAASFGSANRVDVLYPGNIHYFTWWRRRG